MESNGFGFMQGQSDAYVYLRRGDAMSVQSMFELSYSQGSRCDHRCKTTTALKCCVAESLPSSGSYRAACLEQNDHLIRQFHPSNRKILRLWTARHRRTRSPGHGTALYPRTCFS